MENRTGDIIASKLSELESVPGAILGLDGWILRAVPAESRRRFLESYEKVIRTVFHPDLFRDPMIKRGRERYIQAAHEAVTFLLRDGYSYDAAVDAIPTKRNPFIKLQQDVGVRDDIISRLDDELTRLKSDHAALQNHLSTVTSGWGREKRKYELEAKRHFSNMEEIRTLANAMVLCPVRSYAQYPVAITWVEYESWFVKTPNRKDISGHLRMGRILREEELLRWSAMYPQVRILGGMTDGMYCDMIESGANWNGTQEEKEAVLARILAAKTESEDFRHLVRPFLLPFICRGMLAMCKIDGKALRLCRVTSAPGNLVDECNQALDRTNKKVRAQIERERRVRQQQLAEAKKRSSTLLAEEKVARRKVTEKLYTANAEIKALKKMLAGQLGTELREATKQHHAKEHN